MLQAAAVAAPGSLLIRARAENMPLASAHFDRVFCIYALHHFGDARAFAREARRVLRPGGAVMVVGLDPHTALDQWWIYDYFPSALAADRARYPSTPTIRALLETVGFSSLTTSVAQHIATALPFPLAVERGYVDRRSTSQLMVISAAEYDAGLQRMIAEQPVLRAELRVFATIGRPPEIKT
jgi:SAM-dependent methyltransferase